MVDFTVSAFIFLFLIKFQLENKKDILYIFTFKKR